MGGIARRLFFLLLPTTSGFFLLEAISKTRAKLFAWTWTPKGQGPPRVVS